MNEKISVFVICVEVIIYLLLYDLHHHCTFNKSEDGRQPVNQALTRQNKASVDTWCMCFNCSQINNEGALVLS